ncbi:beta-galactosidase [Niabella sp. CC-SYL272]|uniref:beta-galactosidase n=1 Tax=Niabella agricola TaxID=2891571 RepID=UPI001F228E44|nr:beta-galactosidase [Niabella agricola]MCF3107363.1 beta-galactosidase [Niabella agricola]
MKKYFLLATFFIFPSAGVSCAQEQVYEIDASQVAGREPQLIPFSGINPQGVKLSANNRFFLKNDQPWFPLMGELHYNRVPPQDWESGILKMKSAGLAIIATYVFWNEHEIAPGVWDWKANRDLRKFVELCSKHHMYVWLRIGPWAHGEQLHGGHPDWIATMPGKRSNDPAYIAAAAKLFNQIGAQVRGLFFKAGGPVIGIQLENEYAGGQAAHISKLKEMAQASGMQPVFWSVTANTVFDQDKMEVIPLQGSYCYRGWEPGGGGPTADFLYGDDQWIMGDALGKLFYNPALFPRGLCEQGAGSQMTYQNRFVVEPQVEAAHLQNQVGRGMNMIGYYMFHGGTQTPGLKEPGLPESYDFQAPIGEFGIIRPSYQQLKILHHFINDFGSMLAAMPQVEPGHPVRDVRNTKDLRFIARVKDNSGFLFLMNTQVRIPMPDKKVAVSVKLEHETIRFPSVTLKGQTSLVLPFNLRVGNLLVKYATAQPLAKIHTGNTTTLFLVKPEGVDPEIVVAKSDGSLIKAPLLVNKPIVFAGVLHQQLRVVLLSRQDAENSWRTTINGKEVLLVTAADLINDGKSLQLQQLADRLFNLKVYPKDAIDLKKNNNIHTGVSGIYTYYSISVAAYRPDVYPRLKKDRAVVSLPASLPERVNDLLLKISYLGGSAAASQEGRLLTDNLFNGTPWWFSTGRYCGKGDLHFDVRKWQDEIIGVDLDRMQRAKVKGAVIEKITVIPQYKINIRL